MHDRAACIFTLVRRVVSRPAERVLTNRQCLVWLLVSAWLMALILTAAPLNRHGQTLQLHPRAERVDAAIRGPVVSRTFDAAPAILAAAEPRDPVGFRRSVLVRGAGAAAGTRQWRQYRSAQGGSHHSVEYCVPCARDGQGHIARSREATDEFKRMTGYPHGRPGYVIDHVIPLCHSGPDIFKYAMADDI